MTGESPVTLEYGKPPRRWRRRRWGYAILACLTLAAAIASWHYRRPIQAWAVDLRADWEFAGEFDAVSDELCPNGATWLAPPGTTPGSSRADVLMDRLIGLSPGLVNSYRQTSTCILFARGGQTAGRRWLAFACISTTGLEVFSFERDERAAPGYDRLLMTPTFWGRKTWDLSVDRLGKGEGDVVEISLSINGGDNRLTWSMTPAPGTAVPPALPTTYGKSHLITNKLVPGTGWAGANEWWPDTSGFRLFDASGRCVELAVEKGVVAIGFHGHGQLAVATASAVHRVELSTGQVEPTYRRPGPRSADVAAFSPDGRWVFIAYGSSPAVVIEVSTGKIVLVGGIAGLARVTFPDPETLLVADNISLRRVRLAERTVEHLVLPATYGNELAAAGERMARESSHRAVNLFDGDNSFLRQFPPLQGLHQLSLSPEGRWLVMKGQDGLSIFDVESGQAAWEHDGNFDLHTARSRIKWSADGQIGPTAGNQYVYLWSMSEPRWAARFPHGRRGHPPDVAISADGKRLAASGSESESIAYWPDLRAALPGGK